MEKTDIINMALDILGENPVVSDDPYEERGRILSRNFQRAVDSVLRAYPWGSARHRVALAPRSDNPSVVWQYAYGLPTDCLRILPLTHNGEETGTEIPFVREGGFILCNQAPPLRLRYIRRPDDLGVLDALVADAISARLAVLCSETINGMEEKRQSALALYQNFLAEAKSVDCDEQATDMTQNRQNWA